MKTYAPDYYPHFRCIADKCRHSCCIGWEIDIDPDSREKYRHVPGPFGKRLNAAIHDGEVSSFILGPDERCPMLNTCGLCDLYTELGEEHLCQICTDHPRFRSFFTDRTEIGLGLCCEEAARLILTREEPVHLILLADDGAEEAPSPEEDDLLALRSALITLMQDHSQSLAERLDALLDAAGIPIPDRNWPAFYRTLEQLDPQWDEQLASVDAFSSAMQPAFPSAFATALGNFTVYLLYRHLPGALEDGDTAGRIAFCVLSVRILAALCAAKADCTLADLLNLARMYSAEIEYSEDNIAALLDALWEES